MVVAVHGSAETVQLCHGHARHAAAIWPEHSPPRLAHRLLPAPATLSPAEPDPAPGASTSHHRLKGQRDDYRAVFDAAPVALLLCEVGTLRVLAANQLAAKLHGASPEQLVGTSLFELRRVADLTAMMLKRAAGQELALGFGYHTRLDGTTFAAQLSVQPVELGGEPIWLCTLKSLEELLSPRDEEQQQKLYEAIGRVAGGVAHDINNLLSVVLSFTNLVGAQLPEGSTIHPDLAEIRAAAERSSALTKQLLGLSRKGPASPRPLQLNELVRRMEKLLRRLLDERLSLELRLEPELDQVLADPAQVERLLLQLASEARSSSHGGGRLTIETRHAELVTDPELGRQVVLCVHDTDCSLTPEVAALATHGDIHAWLESEPGGGARFVAHFPSVTGPRSSVPPPAPRAASREETVLVVQDNPHLRKTLKTYFAREGFHVLDAGTSLEALRLAEQAPRLDLLLCDFSLPDGAGLELASALRARLPRLKLLLALGHPEQRAALREDELTGAINKPFDLKQFGALVRTLLEGGRR